MKGFQKDVTAGLVVGVVAIPLGLAFAIASGVEPIYGLYTTIIAGILISILGGSSIKLAVRPGRSFLYYLESLCNMGMKACLLPGF